MKKNQMTALILAAALCMFPLVGCEGNQSSSGGAPASSGETTVLKLAHCQPDGHPIDEGADKFAALVAERTAGRVEIQVFPSNTMGAESVTRDMVKEGSCDMVLLGSAAINYNTAMDLASAFYLLRNTEETDFMLYDSDFAKQYFYDDWLSSDGVRLLDSWTQSPRITMSVKEFRSPEELKSIKLRVVAGVPMWEKAWSNMGAMTVSLALDDAFSGLNQGVCDGVEGPIEQLFFYSFQEVAKNLILTNHCYYSYMMLINEATFQTLSPEDQKVIAETALECGDYADQLRDENVDALQEKMREAGVTITELTGEELETLEARALKVVDDNMSTWGQDVYDDFMRELEAFRSGK